MQEVRFSINEKGQYLPGYNISTQLVLCGDEYLKPKNELCLNITEKLLVAE